MAAINQINVNIGTEQSPNYVLHDVNDKRISSTAVTTATHLLATDASLSAINPITAANLASVLGGLRYIGDVNTPTNLDGIFTQGLYYGNPADTIFSNKEPACVCVINIDGKVIQYVTGRDSGKTISRSYNGSSWSSWQRLDAFGCATESELASLLGGVYHININESKGLTKNNSVYLLINDNSRECYSNLHVYSVSYPDGGGYNNRNINFYVTSVSQYEGYTDNATFITPFDGNNNRQIVDYTYQGVTYKAIQISTDQYGKCKLCVIGNSSLARIIV